MVGACVAIALLFALAVTLLTLVLALFYGPAWVALEEQHGPFMASLTVAAATGLPMGVWAGCALLTRRSGKKSD
jgi:hypothetical protein